MRRVIDEARMLQGAGRARARGRRPDGSGPGRAARGSAGDDSGADQVDRAEREPRRRCSAAACEHGPSPPAAQRRQPCCQPSTSASVRTTKLFRIKKLTIEGSPWPWASRSQSWQGILLARSLCARSLRMYPRCRALKPTTPCRRSFCRNSRHKSLASDKMRPAGLEALALQGPAVEAQEARGRALVAARQLEHPLRCAGARRRRGRAPRAPPPPPASAPFAHAGSAAGRRRSSRRRARPPLRSRFCSSRTLPG